MGTNVELPKGFSLPNLPGRELSKGGGSLQDPSDTWESFIPWIKGNTKLEIWLWGSKFTGCSTLIHSLT